MKKARLIYNPYSGDRSFRYRLDLVIDKLERGGYEVTPYRTMSVGDIYESMERAGNCDCIISSGGDGTLNHVISAMIKNDIHAPLGIFPSGTANDFAAHVGIPKRVTEACDIIVKGKTMDYDVGKINDRYFVNVAAAGLLTDISPKIDINMKNTLGKMAYYIKGIEQIPNFRAIPVTIKQNDNIIQASIYLFVILNGSTAGGFKLAPGATARDGKLNLIAIKACSMVDLLNFFIKMLKGEHLESNSVIYLTGDKFSIECGEKLDTDIDGEAGPTFPLDIGVERRRIKVFVP